MGKKESSVLYRQKTRSDKERIISLYQSGLSYKAIGLALGMCESHIARFVNRYIAYGDRVLDRVCNAKPSASFKIAAVRSVLEKSLSCQQVALQCKVSESSVYNWVKKVRASGYDSLDQVIPRKRPTKAMGRPKKREPQTELELLQDRVMRLEVENALLKKVKALVEARDAQLRKIGRKPSKD